LIGSNEGIAHVPLAFIDPGDFALVTSPGYPVYAAGVAFAGGRVHTMDLLKANRFLPDLSAVPRDIRRQAKLMFINYPNNPTAAVASPEFFREVVDFAVAENIIVCHDAAYTETAFDGYRPLSFLEIEGATQVGIEFHSLSKTYNMTGWRLGLAAGSREVIQALSQVKSNIDSGAFQAIQCAGIAALEGDPEWIARMQRIYSERRDVLVTGLRDLGLQLDSPRATFYVWIEIPPGYTSTTFASLLLTMAGVVVTPGNGFGAAGEGYIRIALTVDKQRIAEAVERIRAIGF
jgi:LL-diaminopimelate aminotransferase